MDISKLYLTYSSVKTYFVWILGYFEGIVGNLNLLDKFYKGWNIRLYHDFRPDQPIWEVSHSYQFFDNLAINSTINFYFNQYTNKKTIF